MPMPLTKEIREKIIYHKKKGAKNKEIAEWLQVNKRSVERIWSLYKKQNTVDSKPHNKGRKPAFDNAVMYKITTKIKEQPDITLEELIAEFELPISISALSRKLTKLDLTFKKRHCLPKSNSVKTYRNSAVSG